MSKFLQEKINPLFFSPIFCATAIFVLSSVFRLFFLDLIEFKYDEAYTVFQLVQFYNHPYLMQVGPPQSTGVYNPPLFNYLMIILSFVSRNPQFLSFVIGLISSISIVVLYLVIRKIYGNTTACATSLFLSLSPWSIIFSRKIWIPDLLLPFAVLFFYLFHHFIIEKDNKFTKLFFATLALLPQMHASGAFFLISTIPVLIIFRKKFPKKEAVIGFCLGLIPAFPYFFRQFASTPFCIDCRTFFLYNDQARPFDFANFLRPFQIISALNWQVLLGSNFQDFWSNLPFDSLFQAIFIAESMALIGGILIILKFKRKLAPYLFYLFLIPFLYLVTKTPSYMHYFVILLPILFFISTQLFIFLLNKNKIYKILTICVILVFVIANLTFEVYFNKFLSNRKIINGDYGSVYSQTKQLVDEQTEQYALLSNFPEVKNYAFMFAYPQIIHAKLGEYFAQYGQIDLAINEFQKSIEINPKDTFSRANLAYIYILTGNSKDAQLQLDTLSTQDSTIAAKLKDLLIKKEVRQ